MHSCMPQKQDGAERRIRGLRALVAAARHPMVLGYNDVEPRNP